MSESVLTCVGRAPISVYEMPFSSAGVSRPPCLRRWLRINFSRPSLRTFSAAEQRHHNKRTISNHHTLSSTPRMPLSTGTRYTSSLSPSSASSPNTGSRLDDPTSHHTNPKHDNNQTQHSTDDLISSLPLTRFLRSPNTPYTEFQPYLCMHPTAQTTHLVSTSLFTPQKIPSQPTFFLHESPNPRMIATCYVGPHLCGHPGYVHGGLSFLLFDDIFARLAAVVFKSGTGMTANMSIDFRAPAVPDRVYVYRAELGRAEGRKVWVNGEMRCLGEFTAEEMGNREVAEGDGVSEEENEGVLVAEAKALFIEPRDTEKMVPLYPGIGHR
ncbi:HotDog domain-containing protein [Aspergillus egyptiacus]|nr:HotDog domain-containing protein [Aspergillus egyptiacus]